MKVLSVIFFSVIISLVIFGGCSQKYNEVTIRTEKGEMITARIAPIMGDEKLSVGNYIPLIKVTTFGIPVSDVFVYNNPDWNKSDAIDCFLTKREIVAGEIVSYQ